MEMGNALKFMRCYTLNSILFMKKFFTNFIVVWKDMQFTSVNMLKMKVLLFIQTQHGPIVNLKFSRKIWFTQLGAKIFCR